MLTITAVATVASATPAEAAPKTRDIRPPQTTITAQPPLSTTSTSAAFSFAADEVASFECKLDTAGFASCVSPRTYSGLTLGRHTFQVRAKDSAGNVDVTPASYSWDITAPPTTTPPGATVVVPASIAADCSRPVEQEINSFLATVPDGSTIQFKAGGCYAQANRIELRDKTNVTVDGQGATFRSGAENTATRAANPNWMLLRARNVRIKNMKIVGNFHLTGTRSQQRVNQASTEGEAGATSQPNAGVSVYGGDGVWVTDMDIREVFGDGVLTGVSEYVENTAPFETPRNVHVERVTATTTARHCFSPNQVDGFWLEDSTGRDCWYMAIDAELDGVEQILRNVHFLRNTFDGFNMGGIFVPVAGNADSTTDIEIRGNRFSTRPDQICNQVILVGAYPTNPNKFRNVVVEENSFADLSGAAVELDHVQGGSIQNNRIEKYSEVGCSYPNVTAPVKVTNSFGVTVANNGPAL